MFEYKIEELKLLNDSRDMLGKCFKIENEISYKDKLAFLDEKTNGLVSYLLELSVKYEEDVKTMPKDKWNSPNTNSFKAWIRKNDTRGVLNNSYAVGRVCLPLENEHYDERYIHSLNVKKAFDQYESFVDEAFYRELLLLYDKEKAYFRTHDEYSICCDKVIEGLRSRRYSTLGSFISWDGDGAVSIYKEVGDKYYHRPATLAELKELINKNEQIAEFEKMLADETHITYDDPKGETHKRIRKGEYSVDR